MGRPKWILVAAILSVGLVGATVAAGPGMDASDRGVAATGPTDPIRPMAAGVVGVGETAESATIAHGLASQEEQLRLGAQQEFERSTFRVLVDADGDAVWQYRFERPIESEEERTAYEGYAERFRTEQTDLFRNFRNQSAELTAAASAERGRSMTAENVTRDAGIEQTPTQEVGYVEMSFRWTNFGRVEGDTVVVGDVFEGGLFLGETQTLIFVAGDDVSFSSVNPEGSTSASSLAESDSVTWTGERQFADRHTRAAFTIAGTGGGGDAGASMLWLLGGGVIGLVLVATLAIVRYGVFSRSRPLGSGTGTDASAGATAAADATDDSDANDGSADVVSATPEEPISDEHRVQQLLEDNGGRMKQTGIVDETEWSKSKVSMLLSEMEEEGTIRKIQVGRENIIALDGHEPEAANSPFDDAE